MLILKYFLQLILSPVVVQIICFGILGLIAYDLVQAKEFECIKIIEYKFCKISLVSL